MKVKISQERDLLEKTELALEATMAVLAGLLKAGRKDVEYISMATELIRRMEDALLQTKERYQKYSGEFWN